VVCRASKCCGLLGGTISASLERELPIGRRQRLALSTLASRPTHGFNMSQGWSISSGKSAIPVGSQLRPFSSMCAIFKLDSGLTPEELLCVLGERNLFYLSYATT
jgi:hypothetical protein